MEHDRRTFCHRQITAHCYKLRVVKSRESADVYEECEKCHLWTLTTAHSHLAAISN